ncbi:hypothetical protein HYS49_03900 [Candidatus Woesearchaeota archaeon]|nr:hypothetical protein [Candidatus Woesearchaeota archaeon]
MKTIGKIVGYAIVPAAFGAVGSFVDYDISLLEGMRQMIVAGLPMAAFLGSSTKGGSEAVKELAVDHPYAFPALSAVLFAALYAFGGLGMEALTGTELNQGFTGAVGGLEGLTLGMLFSAAANHE